MQTIPGFLRLSLAVLPMILACTGPAIPKGNITAHPPHVIVLAATSANDISVQRSGDPRDQPTDLFDSHFFEDPEEEALDLHPADPLEGFNRAMFQVNDKLYFWLLKPVALGYSAAVPEPARVGLRNFFYNLAAPVRIVNNILQGKSRSVEAEIARFLYNSTVGVMGFANPAAKYPDLNREAEDLGQTLGRWGIKDGLFIFLPGIGPTTLRDSIGIVGDHFLSPVGYVAKPFEVSLAASGLDLVNGVSLRIGDYESMKKAAFDPYQAFRDAYLQLRAARIRN